MVAIAGYNEDKQQQPMMQLWSAISALFGDIFVAAWLTFTLAAAFVGAWALLIPAHFIRINTRFSRWVDLRREPERHAPKSIHVERWFYRHHRLAGTALIAGAAYTLYEVLFRIDPASVNRAVSGFTEHPLAQVLVDAAFGYVYIAGVFAVVLGIVIFLRPSMLKGFEAWSNRWVATEELGSFLDERNHTPDQWVARHPRLFGSVVIIGGIATSYGIFSFWY